MRWIKRVYWCNRVPASPGFWDLSDECFSTYAKYSPLKCTTATAAQVLSGRLYGTPYAASIMSQLSLSLSLFSSTSTQEVYQGRSSSLWLLCGVQNLPLSPSPQQIFIAVLINEHMTVSAS
jgi:hypothetical protein